MAEYKFKDYQRVAVAWVGLEDKLKLGIGHIDNDYEYDSTKIRNVSNDGNNENHIFVKERYNEIIPIQDDKDIVFAWKDDDGKIHLKSGNITFECGNVVEIDHRERVHKIDDCDEYFLSYGFKTKKNITQKEVKMIKLKDNIIPNKENSPKYKIGDRVRCKVHDKEFVIRNIHSDTPPTYYDSEGETHKVCNEMRHRSSEFSGGFEGVLEYNLELVDDNKSEYNFKEGDIVAVYNGDKIHVGEYTHETNDDLYIKLYKHIHPTGFLKAHYEFTKIPIDTDVVYTYKDMVNSLIFGYGKIIKEDDDSILLDPYKDIAKSLDNKYFICVDWGKFGKDCTVKSSWRVDNENNKFKINNLNQEDTTMNTNFSICGFLDEILTGLDPLTKTFKRKKIKQQLESNQDEINRRINSEFWEDGTVPNKKRILEVNAEIVQEIRTGQKN